MVISYNNQIYSDPETTIDYVEPTPYENTDRMAELKTARLEKYASDAEQRAAQDPAYDITNRPQAPAADNNYIYYYSWIGGTTTGEWVLYRAPNTAENQFKYGSRSFGGETQATYGSSLGANALKTQPQPIRDQNGNIIGWNIPEGSGVTGTGVTGTSTTGTTSGSTSFKSTGGSFGGTGGFGGTTGNVSTEAQNAARSAYDLLFEQFNQYGLGGLIEPLKGFITEGISPAEFTIRLRETDAYKKRFAANAQRIARGLTALSEAEYIGLEDQYQSIMRNYGLPASYYTRGDMGRQEGFERFIAGDVSAAELEDRIITAQNRVINAAPQVGEALRQFYPGITNGDILAYALDPDKALSEIKRKVTAAEIGGAAMAQGLATGVARAEELGRYGVTAEQARQGYQAVASVLPRASVLGDIYAKQGLGEYNQATAEQEVFGIAGSAEAERKRRKLSELEQASFSGSSGIAQGALARDRAGAF